jgi:predicted secreted protein
MQEMIAVAPGETFDVSLQATAAAGYVWQMADVEPAIVDLLGSDFELSSTLAGAPAKQIFHLRALSPGEVTLRFSYGRPWESPARERSVQVRVTASTDSQPGAVDAPAQS